MVFSSNPLALSVSEPAFESWLRDGGYLEALDHHTTLLHNRHITTTTNTTALSPPPPLFSFIWTLLSLFTLNPFAKLTTDDFSLDTPSWTLGFVGSCDSYSIPSSPPQARLRVHENVKRYARNYASLFIFFFACSLYQMPLALVGLLSSLALWDAFRLCSDRWGLHQYPAIKQVLIRIVQCATVVILLFSNVQMALLCALGVSYTAMLLHAAFRKLTPMKQPTLHGSSK